MSEKGISSLLLSMIAIIIILSSIIALREIRGMPQYPNGESYYNLRVAQELTKDPFYDKDPLQGSPYYPNAYHYFLALCIMVFSVNKTAYFAPILLGTLFSISFYRLLANLNFPRNNASFSTVLLAVTPAFIILFSGLYVAGFTVLISILALLLFFEKNYWECPWKVSGKFFFILSIICLSVLAMTSLIGFAISVIFLIVLSRLQSRSLKSVTLAITPPILILLSLSTFTSYLSAELSKSGFEYFDITQLFSIFGAHMGFDIFLFLLFFTGLTIIWGYFSSLRAYHLLSLALIATSLFNPLIRVYASLVITVYCVFAIKYLFYSKWELETVKTGTLILLVCALVFSCLSQVSTLINAGPDAEAKALLDTLGGQSNGIVLTQPEYGYIVQYQSGKETMLDQNKYALNYYNTLGDYNYILGLVRIKDVEPMLAKYRIRYILITPFMKESVWQGKEQELLLLLRNSERFRKITGSPEGFELWLYKG
jgi:hypothetical protein